MHITRLRASNIRNLEQVEVAPSPGLNLIIGENGSGKTSLLECIHLLGMGRSFRTRKGRPLVRDGSASGTVFGELRGEGVGHRLGIEKRTRGKSTVRVDGRDAQGAAELAQLLPIQLVTPESHELVDGGPGGRRAYLDWALFHVEQSFFPRWRRYTRALQQRNKALKGETANSREWNQVLATEGEAIDSMRRQIVAQVTPLIEQFVERLTGRDDIYLQYRSGWNEEDSLAVALAAAEERDRRVGFTTVGPHRGDLKIQAGGHAAGEILSRGQEKLVVCALKLAESRYLFDSAGIRGVILVDDLPAELDSERRQRLSEALAQTESQVFVTTLEAEQVPTATWEEIAMFHVEHGSVTGTV